MSEGPNYPTWIKASRIRLFWILTGAVLLVALVGALFWLPALALAALALPFAYIALVITLSSHRLSPKGTTFRRRSTG